MRKLVAPLRILLLALLWPTAAVLVAHLWPGLLFDWFSFVELILLGLAVAASLLAVSFSQWRVTAAGVLLLTAWAGLRFTDVPASVTLVPILALAVMPWLRERGITGPPVILCAATVLVAIGLLLHTASSDRVLWALQYAVSLPVTELPVVTLLAGLGSLALLVRIGILCSAPDTGLTGALAALIPVSLAPALDASALAAFVGATLALWTGLLMHVWRMAYLDELTRLPNRRALEERLKRLPGRWSVAMVDIDHFKQFNDQFGHDTGDQVLRRVATVISGVRGRGRAYRYGGEEFAIVFPHRDMERAAQALEKVRQAVRAEPFRVRGGQREGPARRGKAKPRDTRRITISIGLACGTAEVRAALEAADQALYSAKESGRDRLVTADTPAPRSPSAAVPG